MAQYSHITDPGELRKLLKTKELRENELKPAQRTALYGRGNPGKVMYRAVERNGEKQIISRTFGPDDKVPQGFVDSPVKCGLVKKPKPKDEEGETVFASLGAADSDDGAKSKGAAGESKDAE